MQAANPALQADSAQAAQPGEPGARAVVTEQPVSHY